MMKIRNFLPALLMAAMQDDTQGSAVGATAGTVEAKPEVPQVVISDDGLLALTPVRFNFRETKIRDNDGKEVGIKKARPASTLVIPYLTSEGLLTKLTEEGEEADKVKALILDLVNGAIYNQAREQIANWADKADDEVAVPEDVLNLDELTIDFIANMPPAARKGRGIPKEVWDAFGEDYFATMRKAEPEKEEVRHKKQADILVRKLESAKGNKPVIKFLIETALPVWFANTEQQDEFKDCYNFLVEKGNKLLTATDETMLANLM